MNNVEIGIKVKLLKPYGQVCETLERMGVVNKKEKIIYPSCYCHKMEDETYRICHFKEMFLLQDKPSTFNDVDSLRRATITYLLQDWGFVDVADTDDISKILTLKDKIDVIPYRDKHLYTIQHKFKQYKIPLFN
jgi:hypothetical protein